MDGVGSGTDGGGATAASVSAMLCSRNLATMMALLVLSTSTEEDEVSLAVVFLSLSILISVIFCSSVGPSWVVASSKPSAYHLWMYFLNRFSTFLFSSGNIMSRAALQAASTHVRRVVVGSDILKESGADLGLNKECICRGM